MKAIEFYTTPSGEVTLKQVGEAESMTDSQVADKLFISLNTVNNHRKNSFKKLGIHSFNEFMRLAAQNNMFNH